MRLASHTWSPDGSQIANATVEGIWVYTLATGDRVRIDDRPPGPSNGLQWGDDGRIAGAFYSPLAGAGLWARPRAINPEQLFEALGLVRLRGTVRYPERAFWEAA